MTNEQGIKKLMIYRWVIWGILALSFVITFFHRMAIGVIREDLVNAFNISSTAFANLGAAYFYPYVVMQLPSGLLADSLGARKSVAIGMFLGGIGSVLFGLAPNYYMAFAGRFLVGLGVSVVFIALLKIQSKWFRENEFATMSGITIFTGNLGGMLAQTPLALLVAYISWRTAFASVGIFSLMIAILCYVLVRNTPEDMGLPSIAEIEGKTLDKTIKEKPPLGKSLKDVVLNKYTWPSFFVFMGVFGSYVAFSGVWGRTYLVEVYGLSSSAAPNYIMVTILGLSIGSILIGKISDLLGKRKLPMLIFTILNAVTWAILIFMGNGKPPIEILYPLFFVMGFSSAAVVLGFACGKEVNNPEFAGISTSVVNIGGFIGSTILPTLMGMVMDAYLGKISSAAIFQKAFIICFVFVLISVFFTMLIKETGCKNIYKEQI
jgi:sugar phosphate permease